MPTLSTTQLAAYATLFDFRTQFVKAARQILDAGGITAQGPGEGNQQVPRYYSSVDFQAGPATGLKATVYQDFGAGSFRQGMYAQFEGVLSVMNTVGYETEAKTGAAYLTEDHVRTIDELTSKELALFMEPLQPFTAALLPNLDVQMILPIEPDERPEQEREVNVAFRRWRVRFQIRQSAWPTIS